MFSQVWSTGIISPLESPRALTDDLPSFSRSPLAYITEVCAVTVHLLPTPKHFFSLLQIGDYLLTLPQQLDPFISSDNAAVMAALKLGQLPHTGTYHFLISSSSSSFSSSSSSSSSSLCYSR